MKAEAEVVAGQEREKKEAADREGQEERQEERIKTLTKQKEGAEEVADGEIKKRKRMNDYVPSKNPRRMHRGLKKTENIERRKGRKIKSAFVYYVRRLTMQGLH